MHTHQLDFIHRFLPARDAKAPTLVLLHGTGGNESDLLDLGAMLYPGAALLSPRGKVLENGMPRFFRRLSAGVFDMADLRRRTDELADFVVSAQEKYHLASQHIVAVGFSNGANIAASTLLLRPGIFARAVLFHPMLPLVPDELPDLRGTSVFIGAGRLDTMTPPQHAERLALVLQNAGAAVTLHWEPSGHALNLSEVKAASTWLQQ